MSPELRMVKDYRKQLRRPMFRGNKGNMNTSSEDTLSNMAMHKDTPIQLA